MILGHLTSSVGNVVGDITGLNKPSSKKTITGSVVMVKKNVLDFSALHSTVADSLFELVGNQVTLQLVSAENPDSGSFHSKFPNKSFFFRYYRNNNGVNVYWVVL